MKKPLILVIFLVIHLAATLAAQGSWDVYLNFPDGRQTRVDRIGFNHNTQQKRTRKVNQYTVLLDIQKQDGYWSYAIEVHSGKGSSDCFISLKRPYTAEETPCHFNGPVSSSVIFRQSPHEPADHEMEGLLMQPVPVAGVKSDAGYELAISNSPVFYNNYTTQTFDLHKKEVELATGDAGAVFNRQGVREFPDSLKRKGTKKYTIDSHYFKVDAKTTHRMEGIFITVAGGDEGKLRSRINEVISRHWSAVKIHDLLGATVFSTAYMNLRVNETGNSSYWVVPAIEYANKQYTRDGFWISMVLPDSFSLSAYEHEAASHTRFTGAERQLFAIVWAYRNVLNGMQVDTSLVRKMLRIVEKRAPGGYYSGFGPSRKAGCWQGWADNLAFDETDAISNNQGLYVVALKCAERMGIRPQVSVEEAVRNYRDLFQPAIGGFSISREKDTILCVDALMGDLLAQVYLGERLLPKEMVLAHYETMKKRALTEVGFKTFCNPDGSYLKPEQYNSVHYTAAVDQIEEGLYQFGGSWYLYDMHMLMDAYLAGAPDAEDRMIWRTKLEFEKGNTTHEYINTRTGIPFKPNMGWNAGIYGMWKELIRQGKATERFLNEINRLK